MTWKRAPKPEPEFNAPLAPDVPFFAIGDIHGCDLLLGRLLERLQEIAHPDARLVTVGDYVDRGEHSRAVLERLQQMQAEAPEGMMVCLRGNHEQMLLDFLDDPAGQGERWLRHGGLQTLASYRVPVSASRQSDADWEVLRDRFREALGEPTEAWLRGLPLSWQTGNVWVVHAGADPEISMGMQTSRPLLWGHEGFGTVPRRDGVWVLHGHTIVEEAATRLGCIAVDTGAYATGRLTCALVEPERLEFIGV
jgi:serine/threonine protein phosphatase 1